MNQYILIVTLVIILADCTSPPQESQKQLQATSEEKQQEPLQEKPKGKLIKVCIDVGEDFGRYKSSMSVYEAVIYKTKQEAVNTLFRGELEQFNYTVLKEKQIVEALIPLIKYDEIKETSDGVFKPCIQLTNPAVSDEDRFRFKAVKIAKLCTPSKGLNKTLSYKTKEFVVDVLVGSNKAKNEYISALLNGQGHLSVKLKKDLFKYIHERDISDGFQGLQSVTCKELYIYPVELLAIATL